MKKAEVMETSCVCNKDIKVETMLIGFPGHGLVGSIATKTIVKEMGLEVVGYIRSPLIPPLAVFLDGVLSYPYRIYGSPEGKSNIAVFIGESPAPVSAYFHLANAALDWGTNAGAKTVICLDGFPEAGSNDEPVYVVAEPDLQKTLSDFNLPVPETGYIGGLAGAVLNETIIRKINGYALLARTTPHMPDPLGAIELIKVLNKLKQLNISTEALQTDAERIRKSLAEFSEKTVLMQEPRRRDDRPGLYL